jgi:hypothetical protein
MLLPACTGTGVPTLVIARSAESATSELTVTLLLPGFGSPVVEVTESVCVIVVPDATVEFTFTISVKLAVVLAAIAVESVQTSAAHVQPAGGVIDTSVVFAGSVSVNTGAFAVAGPALITLCV